MSTGRHSKAIGAHRNPLRGTVGHRSAQDGSRTAAEWQQNGSRMEEHGRVEHGRRKGWASGGAQDGQTFLRGNG